MKNLPNKNVSGYRSQVRQLAGFTMIELMVALAMFLVIGGATFTMFAKNAPYFTQQQNTAALNIALQNVVSQMQLDLANAGTGYYPGFLLPSWPIGVTINNQPYTTTACNTPSTYTYSATCFDQLNVLTINPNVQPSHPTDPTGGTGSGNCSATAGTTLPAPGVTGANMAWHSAQIFYIQAISGLTLAQTAAEFSQGDQVILVQSTAGGGGDSHGTSGGNPSVGATNGATINTFVLTGPPVVGASYVELPFNAGNPTAGTGNSPPEGMNTTGDDPLGISTSSTASNVGYKFCSGDWVMKLDPTTYQVDVSNPQDPKLIRTHNVNGTVNNDVIAEQIIGFKVGAATWQTGGTASTTLYSFYGQNQSSDTPVGYNNNFALVRAVRVTLIGRTAPNPTNVFRNTFDQGPYQVLGADVVISPRNMTMN